MARPLSASRRRIAVGLTAAQLALLGVAPAVAAVALPDTGLFAPVASQLRALAPRTELPPGMGAYPPDLFFTLLDAGNVDVAYANLSRLPAGREGDVARARVLLAFVSLKELKPVAERLAAHKDANESERAALYAALFVFDDPARVDRLTKPKLVKGDNLPEWLAAGRLAYDQQNYPRADSLYSHALEIVNSRKADAPGIAAARARALTGKALVLQKRRDWDGSLARLKEALEVQASPEVLTVLNETLIRLGRTDEAISAMEWAVRLNLYNDAAHYALGNGYARKNYTELAAAYPQNFADSAGRRALLDADRQLFAGHRADARKLYQRIVDVQPQWVDASMRIASLDFENARFAEARARCLAALLVCPEYGRAHAILAKALESQRFEVDVHRPGYEQRFAAAKLPKVPGIEKFVTNWKALSPRHQKRVALSIAPWQHYIPVLVEGGSTYYIKPLYMLLSDTPGLETLRDTRINYDSRLWDDVRGAGGYNTVTGVEDVERTIFDRYNTVLHELTHQVHAVLTADQSREIQEHYRRAKERDDKTKDGYMSRYAGGSVFEYFAEGANALESPMRDAYDPREVVRERLVRIDPDLMKLEHKLLAVTDVSASYPVAYTNAGDDRVQRGKVDEALPYYHKALARSPREETALQSLTRTLSLGNRGTEAALAGDSALAKVPDSGGIVTTSAFAWWHGGRGLDPSIQLLEKSRSKVRAEDRYQIDLAIGNLAWIKGDSKRALAAYDSVLAYQSDHPEGLWGRASSLALAQKWNESFAVYVQAVRMRTGVVGLRCDYARDLIRAGKVSEARAQLDEAKLLEAENPNAEAMRGWAALAGGDPAAAKKHAEQALAWGDWCDLARLVLGAAEQASGNAAAATAAWAPVKDRIAKKAPPEYVFREKQSSWEQVHELPAVERSLMGARP
jgi:tetratricopeptide (TPR) repeat protein